ncbi:type VI secretion system protein TssA [Albibacillus kandeliae]|uniref:type VI secretion system protein TssA n=1 Tax=Albibacillus kandeliae TaxID=2174228 RepID=UPI000D68B177|nr:type VI secretion system protein TssA [Albibacillus kandeliae]
MDPVALLEARSDDAPSGENLEYDPVFVEMELAAQPGEETQIGDTITAAEDPDYKEVIEKAQEVLQRSHDLRAAVYLADAILHTEGLIGFSKVTTYIRGCLEQHWATCHPELDEDDDDDPTMRVNAIQGLCGNPGGQSGPSPVYRSLRSTPLSESRGFGRFTMRDIEIAEGLSQAPEGMDRIPDSASISAAFQDSDEEVVQGRLKAAQTALDDLKAISKVFDENTPGQGPELDPVIKLMGQIAKALGKYAGGDAVEPEEDGAESDDGAPMAMAGDAPARAGGGAVGAIRSPNDVANALDRIIEYYQRYEPSSPLPILLRRAKRLVNADFLTIIRDIAPNGIDNVNLVGGIDDE